MFRVTDCLFAQSLTDTSQAIYVGTDDTVIRGCTFRNFDTRKSGVIEVHGEDVRVEDNLFENISSSTSTSAVFVLTANGGPASVTGNTFKEVHRALTSYTGGVIVNRNVVEGSADMAIVCQGDGCLVEGNLISGATTAGVWVSGKDNKVLNNMITDTVVDSDGYGSIRVRGGIADVRGNQIVLNEPNPNALAIRVDAESDVTFLKNNIARGYAIPSIKFHGEYTGFVSDNIEE